MDIDYLSRLIAMRPEIPDGEIDEIKIVHDIVKAGNKITIVRL